MEDIHTGVVFFHEEGDRSIDADVLVGIFAEFFEEFISSRQLSEKRDCEEVFSFCLFNDFFLILLITQKAKRAQGGELGLKVGCLAHLFEAIEGAEVSHVTECCCTRLLFGGARVCRHGADTWEQFVDLVFDDGGNCR